jgi:hypothetical protein
MNWKTELVRVEEDGTHIFRSVNTDKYEPVEHNCPLCGREPIFYRFIETPRGRRRATLRVISRQEEKDLMRT